MIEAGRCDESVWVASIILWGSSPGGPRPPMEPAKLVALMAEGDLVVRITTRGPNMIWNLFRVQNGQLAEHWDAGTGGGAPPAAGLPGAPAKK